MPANQVSNEELRSSDVPARDADWTEVVAFANTFSEPENTANDAEVLNRYRDTGFWQGTLSELRARLYWERRVFDQLGIDPTEADMERIQDLLDAIRLKVKSDST